VKTTSSSASPPEVLEEANETSLNSAPGLRLEEEKTRRAIARQIPRPLFNSANSPPRNSTLSEQELPTSPFV